MQDKSLMFYMIRSELEDAVGVENVSTKEIERAVYSVDYFWLSRKWQDAGEQGPMPDIIVRPGTTEEVSKVMKIANYYKIPVTTWGGGSGSQGGALPVAGGILLDIKRLDKLIEGTGLDVRIAYRDDGRPIHLPELKNIRLVPLKAVKYFYNLAVLPAYLRRTHAFYVGLASDMLLTKRSVVVLHDIRPLVMDTDKGFFRFKFWVHCLSTKWFAQRVFTVSDNQRHLISEKLGIPLDKIGITYNGWEHMKGVTPDESIFDNMPGVVKGEYYYALGSLAKHKNFKWIREVARRNPDKTFVVAGGKDLRAFGDDAEAKDTHNVFYPGYVSDAENAALMKHCKLFLHPAVFEGFGIPPLEALALGAPIALANATCLPELYGDTARYFDPYDYDTDLDKLAAQPVAAPDEVLQKYSWDRTANFWLHEIEKYAKM